MQLKRAGEFPVSDLTSLWNRGYAGFFVPSELTERQMAGFIWASDLDLKRSVIAMDGDRPAGFSLLGARGRRGWIAGIAVAPEYRGRGLASALFAGHLALIREESELAGVQLEVLVQNWAGKIYARQGFATVRRLLLIEGRLPEGRTAPDGCTAAGTAATPGAPNALLAHSDRLHGAWPPAWQREADDLRKCLPPVGQALWTGPIDSPTGYLVYNPHGRDIWIADAAAGGSVSVAAHLIDALARAHPGCSVRVGDEPEGSPFHQALAVLGCRELQTRHEMHWAVPVK